MSRLLLSMCLALAGIASAWALDTSLAAASPQTGEVSPLAELPEEALLSKGGQAPDSWGEWQQGFTGTADPYVADLLRGLFGDLWVEFPAPFDILTRENTANPRLVQYKLVNVFNHVDIVLDYDRDTQVLSAQEQDTGIINAYHSTDPDYYYETYRFRLTGVKMFEQSKTVYYLVKEKPYHLLIAPNYGYALNINYLFTFDDIPYCGITPDDYYPFIPSTEISKTVNLTIPAGVARYRVVDFTREEYEDGTLSSSLRQLYLKEPGADARAFTVSSSTAQTLTPDEMLSYRVLIPLDADGKAAYYGAFIEVSWNKPLEGEWVPAGTVTLKDNLWGYGLDHYREDFPFLDYVNRDEYGHPRFIGEAPATQQLPIETLSTNPSVYRIKNPYGATHPYREYIANPTDTDDDFYLVIDATDPAQVVLRPSLAGFNYAYEEPFMFDNSGFASGKMADGKISFPFESIAWEHGMAYWMRPLLEDVTLDIEFPGYVDYSMKPDGSHLDEDGFTGHFSDISPNVAKIEYALFDYNLYRDELQRFPEKLGKMIADRAEGVNVYSAIPAADRTATLSVARAEMPYGFLSMVAVAVDAQGNHHGSYVVGDRAYNQTPLSMWPSAGNSTLNGWFIQGWSFSHNDNTHAVDLRVSPDQDGVYCLHDPFKAEYAYLTGNFAGADMVFSYDDTEERDIYINVSNPGMVYISDLPEAFVALDYGMATGLSSDDTGDYTLYQFYETYGKAYTDHRGLDVIDLSKAIGVMMQTSEHQYASETFVITIDYDPDRDLSLPVNWENVATVTVEENLLSSCEGHRTVVSHQCQLNRHPSYEGIYALIDPLRESGPVNPSWTFDNGQHHMILNLADPGKVFFDGDMEWNNAYFYVTGYTHEEYGKVDMLYMVNAICQGRLGIDDPAPYYGTALYDDASASLPTSINLDKGIYPVNLSSGRVDVDAANHFRVLIKQTGVDGVLDDEPAEGEHPVAWYNLQGARVASPDLPGVYVRVCGGHSEKVVVK